ncbi:MAG: diaminopimelate epimerase [Bryobacteraceae bacterium]
MRIPFTKAHGALNDFLLTWAHGAAPSGYTEIARAICDRHAGIGADGWMLVGPPSADRRIHGATRLFNSDGSEAEISGNGTRCAAAFLVDAGLAHDSVSIRTGAGVKELRLIERSGDRYLFEMNMGRPSFPEPAPVTLDVIGLQLTATIVDVGNPQCAVHVDAFDFDWRGAGAAVAHHARFPNRTNVSFVRRADGNTIDVRFWERGAGETMSSGTGSTGAAAVAMRLGWVTGPVTVRTPAGSLNLRIENDEIFLTGPAQIVGVGEFYL